MPRLTSSRFQAIRDVVLLVCGIGLLMHEALAVPSPRIELLALAAGMIGLPATLLADRRLDPSSPPSPAPPPTSPSQSSGPAAGPGAQLEQPGSPAAEPPPNGPSA